jgi:hypothetical protein
MIDDFGYVKQDREEMDQSHFIDRVSFAELLII